MLISSAVPGVAVAQIDVGGRAEPGAGSGVPITRPGEEWADPASQPPAELPPSPVPAMPGGWDQRPAEQPVEQPSSGQQTAAACSACGAPLPEGARFCPRCGRDLSQAMEQPPAIPAPAAAPVARSGKELLSSAHAAMKKDRQTALRLYRQAVDADRAVAADGQMLENVVRMLAFGSVRAEAATFLKTLGAPAVTAVAAAQSAPGDNYYLRHHSAELLEEWGHKPDWVQVYINDLKYCTDEDANEDRDEERRETAVRKLGEYRDSRAIPQLRESAKRDDDWSVRRPCKKVLEDVFGIEM